MLQITSARCCNASVRMAPDMRFMLGGAFAVAEIWRMTAE
jgi:hypothetical protein